MGEIPARVGTAGAIVMVKRFKSVSLSGRNFAKFTCLQLVSAACRKLHLSLLRQRSVPETNRRRCKMKARSQPPLRLRSRHRIQPRRRLRFQLSRPARTTSGARGEAVRTWKQRITEPQRQKQVTIELQ